MVNNRVLLYEGPGDLIFGSELYRFISEVWEKGCKYSDNPKEENGVLRYCISLPETHKVELRCEERGSHFRVECSGDLEKVRDFKNFIVREREKYDRSGRAPELPENNNS